MLPNPPAITTNPKPQPQPARRLSLTDLQSELNKPRQDVRPPQLDTNGQPFTQPDQQQPGMFPGEGPNINAPITDQTAAAAGEQIATFIDYVSSGACGLISGNDSSKYAIKAAEKRDLSNAYAKVAQRYGFSGVNPVFEAVMLTGIILIPNFRTAAQDRKLNKLKTELEDLKQEVKEMKDESKRNRTDKPANPGSETDNMPAG